MTNQEKYKRAFSVLQVSDKFSLEVINMTNINRKQKLKQMVAGIAACVLLVCGTATAYAIDLGGIQRTLQLWIHGDKTEVTIEYNYDGSYRMEYLDNEGNVVHQGGGGVAIDDNGEERPLTEEELLEYLNSPEVVYEGDGSVWIYYFDQKIDITDKFDDGICYAKVSNGKETLYMTIKYQGGWSSSTYKYPSPSSFN